MNSTGHSDGGGSIAYPSTTVRIGLALRRWLVRMPMTAAARVRGLGWRLSRRPIAGVRAIVLTPAGEIVLVRQSYTRGWHLPAGGVGRRERPERAMPRELAEEIGFLDGVIELWIEEEGLLGRRPHRLSTFIVRDARYRPRWNLEIEEVRAFPPAALPDDLARASRAAILAFLSRSP